MPIGIYRRTAFHLSILAKARLKIVRGPLSEDTKQKISIANTKQQIFYCDSCGKLSSDRPSQYAKKHKHFCSTHCYSEYRKTIPKEQHPRWKGIGTDKQNYHRRYVASHPDVISHLKARRYAREKGAKGSHTLEEWQELKYKFNQKCAKCEQEKPLTKDHIIPLSSGGSDNIENIQPLCRNCNSKKWKKLNFNIYENPSLLEGR